MSTQLLIQLGVNFSVKELLGIKGNNIPIASEVVSDTCYSMSVAVFSQSVFLLMHDIA